MNLPRLLKPIIDIAIPWNVLEEAPDDREKVRKIGYICRGAAIFQVSKIIIYRYGRFNENEINFIRKNIEYLITPPYLRKDLFKIEPELKYAGLLPPLKTPCHYVASRNLKPGDIVEGVVVRWDGYFSIVKIGEKMFAKIPKPYPIGSRLVLRIEAESEKGKMYRAHVIDKDKLRVYWNLSVDVKYINEVLKDEDYGLIILTGREGKSIVECFEDIVRMINNLRKNDKKILVMFGSPKRGIDEIFREEGLDLSKYMFINFIPDQGVETIRTEEAIISVLSILHFIRTCISR